MTIRAFITIILLATNCLSASNNKSLIDLASEIAPANTKVVSSFCPIKLEPPLDIRFDTNTVVFTYKNVYSRKSKHMPQSINVWQIIVKCGHREKLQFNLCNDSAAQRFNASIFKLLAPTEQELILAFDKLCKSVFLQAQEYKKIHKTRNPNRFIETKHQLILNHRGKYYALHTTINRDLHTICSWHSNCSTPEEHDNVIAKHTYTYTQNTSSTWGFDCTFCPEYALVDPKEFSLQRRYDSIITSTNTDTTKYNPAPGTSWRR